MIKKTKDGKNWYEDSFPPKHRMVSRFRGYDTWNERMLFYEFAVNHYDMFLVYNGKKYIFEIDSEGVRMVDDKQIHVLEKWETAVEFINNFRLNGEPLYKMVNRLEEIDCL